LANHKIKDPKEFSTELRKLEISDPAHADTFNPLYEKLINNDVYLKQEVDKKETPAGAQSKADTAESNAKAYTDTKVGNIQVPVTSVNSKTGAVVLKAEDVGAEPTISKKTGFNLDKSDSVTSTSSTTLATSKAVKTAMDKANEAFQSASDGKNQIATAITGMGQNASGSDTFPTLAGKIRDISKDANAATSDVLSGKTFYQGGSKRTGAMPNQGAKIITPSTANQTIVRGYHNGSGYVKGDSNLVPENIVLGKSIFGVNGTFDKEVTKIQADILAALRLPGLPKGVSAITGRYRKVSNNASGYVTAPSGTLWVGLYPPYTMGNRIFVDEPYQEYIVLEIDLPIVDISDSSSSDLLLRYGNDSDKPWNLAHRSTDYTLIHYGWNEEYNWRRRPDYAIPLGGSYTTGSSSGYTLRVHIPGANVVTITKSISANSSTTLGTVPSGEMWLVSIGRRPGIGADIFKNGRFFYSNPNGEAALYTPRDTIVFKNTNDLNYNTVVCNIMKFNVSKEFN